jgi:hypothetical protein
MSDLTLEIDQLHAHRTQARGPCQVSRQFRRARTRSTAAGNSEGPEGIRRQAHEREAFEELLDEVDSLSDAMTEHDQEGGPGMSSTYAGYFAKSQARAKDAMASFAKPGK